MCQCFHLDVYNTKINKYKYFQFPNILVYYGKICLNPGIFCTILTTMKHIVNMLSVSTKFIPK